MADGRRGRRWRETTTGTDGRLVHSLLLEVGGGGRLERLELSTPFGLLTLHPEADESQLHGNVVRRTGIEHAALPWSPEHVLFVEPSPVSAAVAVRRLEARIGVGERAALPVVEIGEDLTIRQATWQVVRLDIDRWQVFPAAGGTGVTVRVDADGALSGLDEAAAWPMELAPTS